jgi:tetratricopeptide (TPR) repeat protein
VHSIPAGLGVPDVFLSCSHVDQARANVFAVAFQTERCDIRWDVGLKTGEACDQVTERALREDRAVVLLWSKRSVESRGVRAEASLNVAIHEAGRAASPAPDDGVARVTLSTGLSFLCQRAENRDHALTNEALEQAKTALSFTQDHATVLFQVVHACGDARRYSVALQLAERAVALNPNIIDLRHVLALCLNHRARYEETLVELAEDYRIASRSFLQPGYHGHRAWAFYGLGRLEEALASITKFARFYSSHLFSLMTRPMILHAPGCGVEVREAIRKTRRARLNEELNFWLGFARGTCMSEVPFWPFSHHFRDLRNTTARESRA